MRPHLTSFERAWTDAAFDAIHPHGTPLGAGVGSMHPASFLDATLMSVPFEQFVGIRLALWIVSLAPFFAIGRLGTIASIAPADRVRVLERLLASPVYAVRQLAMSFKAMAALLYAQSQAIRAAMTTPRAERVVTLRKKSHDVDGGKTHEHAAE